MLSYQHIYHAGNLADVHKHALLAWMLAYLTRKDKPLSYLETHAGRALYDLSADAARKTGEAQSGITQTLNWFDPSHPYRQVIDTLRESHGETFYPGSPMIAAHLLRSRDRMDLAELHPQEHAALDLAMSPYPARCHMQDGIEMAFSLCPPTPRRGLMLIDPSFEIKTDYDTLPRAMTRLHRAWNVGIIALWYPILTNGAQRKMVRTLKTGFPDGLCSEVSFPPARPGHGMIGSGLFVINPPFGLDREASRLASQYQTLTP